MTARAMHIPYTELEGTGNDFVLIDAIRHPLSSLDSQWNRLAQRVCDPRQGTGTDGLLVLGRSRRADVRMRIFNPDGSEPSMCGNGIRCVAWYANRSGAMRRKALTIETKAGIKRAEILAGHRVRIDMGPPALRQHWEPTTLAGRGVTHCDWVDSGVPHLVCWVADLRRLDVERLGRRLRHHRRFQPHGTNVDFVQFISARRVADAARGRLVSRVTLAMRTYERGVEEETQACGTGAVAAAAAWVHAQAFPRTIGRESDVVWAQVEVRVPGGRLRVEVGAKALFDQRRLAYTPALLEGPVKERAKGMLTWNGRSSA